MEQLGDKIEGTFMRFKDLPVGTRFKYPGLESTWVVIEAFGDGLIAEWRGVNQDRQFQSLCSFVDEDCTLETMVKIIE